MERQAGKSEEQARGGRFQSELFSWGESLLFVLIAFVVIFTFFVRMIGVDGSSMHPTLEDHNIMLVSNWGYTPQKGDVVIVNKPEFWNNQPIVKRVIATGGDTIDINFETGEVIRNGEVLDEPYIAETTREQGDMMFPQKVPQGSVFVMGDNRNASTDSRFTSLGMVDERYVLGHVLSVIYPFNKFGAVS